MTATSVVQIEKRMDTFEKAARQEPAAEVDLLGGDNGENQQCKMCLELRWLVEQEATKIKELTNRNPDHQVEVSSPSEGARF